MTHLTRDGCRQAFADSGIQRDSITKEMAKQLRHLINAEMVSSGLFKGEYRMNPTRNKHYLACRSFYFSNREAVSFNNDGFVGFAGWADEKNVQPILRGFIRWVSEVSK